ncbi:MAG: beta-ketoacyl synthase N-terminal-like domain-containing protein [Thermodesulfobacteriota bacterium]|nr:beta-ketoacyl synthase N-terminal-like domain-containing protein [Thermodesulfobacteriota bacterium]
MTMLKQKMAIAGIGCVGGFGCGVDDLAVALQQGYTLAGESEYKHPSGEGFLPALLAQTDSLTDYVPRRSLRRIDHYSRMALLGGYLALADAGIASDQCGKLGIIVASGYGATSTTFNFLDSIINDGDCCASPTSFSNSVHNVAAAYLSMQLQALGPNLTVSQFDMSISSALHNAACWLAQGRVDTVLVGGVDEHSSVLNYCYQHYFADHAADLTQSDRINPSFGRIKPFTFDRQSAIIGEGASFMVLSRDPSAVQYGFITDLEAGNVALQTPQPSSDVLIIGADGHRDSGVRYAQLQPTQPLVSCAPCYGSLPVGQAFDLAAAALMLRDQRCYGVAKQRNNDGMSIDTIQSLKIAADGQFSQIGLSTGGADHA